MSSLSMVELTTFRLVWRPVTQPYEQYLGHLQAITIWYLAKDLKIQCKNSSIIKSTLVQNSMLKFFHVRFQTSYKRDHFKIV